MRTRLAPSPTGYLHLGHAYSSLFTQSIADTLGLELILRIENIDHTRCRPEYVTAVAEDIEKLGILPEGPVIYQADRFPFYQAAIQTLSDLNLLFPCTCTRADLEEAPRGPDGPIYPGTCRQKQLSDIPEGTPYALRLNLDHAINLLKDEGNWPLFFEDMVHGPTRAEPQKLGDVVIARKEFPTSYHLSVVCDDAAQGISHIIRGADLYELTHVHRLLQALLGLPTPKYLHHGLIVGRDNSKLSKSAASTPLRELAKQGLDLADLQNSFDKVREVGQEPGSDFLQALPESIRKGLTFMPFNP